MKSLTAWFALLMLSLMLPSFVFAKTPSIQLFYNGNPIAAEVAPRIVGDGTTIVPLRVIAESLGSKVDWDEKARKVKVDKDDTSIQLTIDKKEAIVNKQTFALEAAPVIINGNTMLPIRFVSEQLGLKVVWDDVTKSVFLYGKDAPTTSLPKPDTSKPDVPAGGTGGSDKPVKAGDKPESGSGTAGGQTGKDNATGSVTVPNEPIEVSLDPNKITVKSVALSGDTLTILTSGGTLTPKVTRMSNPERVILDLPGTQLDSALAAKVNPQGEGTLAVKNEWVSKIRYSLFSKEESIVRIVIDLPQKLGFLLGDTQKPGEVTGKVIPPKSKYRVFIDPGHGGKDTGAISVTKRREKDFVLALGKKVTALLSKEPKVEVLMTRSDDTFVELPDRVSLANGADADLFVSIHANSAAKETVQGTETYYWTEQSLEFAKLMHQYLLQGTGFPDRKVKQERFHVIRYTSMPSVLLEIGFLTNRAEDGLMYQDEFQNKVAASIVAAIKKQLNLE